MILLTAFTFFSFLGSRGLNEPDEGRYAEIAREMIESGNWLAPHFWYLPHFDKPPMAYWLVAASLKIFGQNEWAVRLPLAVAGLSGVWAAWLLACSIGGRLAGRWSVLILQTSLLYFTMARMLTTDIFLTQFVAWAVYFFWRSWLELNRPVNDVQHRHFWSWHLAGWLAITLGFLTKGPIALVLPLVALAAPVVFRWKTFSRKGILFGGLFFGLILFFAFASLWFLAADRRVPHVLDYMLFHQAAGHMLGTAIKNRRGAPLYYFAILTVGLLPWPYLVGWMWRRRHWRGLGDRQKEGWLMLTVWVGFALTLFSFMHSKLPAYILPIFPAIAVMLGVRFFGESENNELFSAPGWAWRCCAFSSLLLLIIYPVLLRFIFHVDLPPWLRWQMALASVAAMGIFLLLKKAQVPQRAAVAVLAGIFSTLVVAKESAAFETHFKFNQTLKPFGLALREHYQAGDVLVCWGQLPEGLPFYSGGTISATNRPFFGGMNLAKVPFEFPGNRERLGPLLLPDQESLLRLLNGDQRVWIVSNQKNCETLMRLPTHPELRSIEKSGEWELLCNR